MLMIWSSRARNRSADPVVSCFFGRIAPSDARPNHASRFEGIAKTNLQASRASDTETLQSQVNKAAKKRLSLNGLEILHGRRCRHISTKATRCRSWEDVEWKPSSKVCQLLGPHATSAVATWSVCPI